MKHNYNVHSNGGPLYHHAENNYNMIINGAGGEGENTSGMLIFPTDLTQVTNVSDQQRFQTLNSPSKRVKSACDNTAGKKKMTERVRRGAKAALQNVQNQQ